MGAAWSTSGKGLKNFNIIGPCYDNEVDVNSRIFADRRWKGLKEVYMPLLFNQENDYRLVKVPNNASVQDFCSLSNISNGTLIDSTESLLIWNCIFLSFLAIYVRGYPAKIGVLIALALIVYRIIPPKETTSWSEALLIQGSLLKSATKFSKSLDTFIAPPSTGSDVAGTTKAVVTEMSEVVRMDAGIVLPLHAHSKFTYAVAVTDGMEFTAGASELWTEWKKGSILGVPPGLNHTVRATTSAMFVSFHPTGALKDI